MVVFSIYSYFGYLFVSSSSCFSEVFFRISVGFCYVVLSDLDLCLFVDALLCQVMEAFEMKAKIALSIN